MLNIRAENVTFNKSDMNGMLNDIKLRNVHTVNKSMGKMKKDFLDFIEKRPPELTIN
jgi:hypothetical protein